MTGESNLERLLVRLDVELHSERYSFSLTDDPTLQGEAFAIVREREGLTVIRPESSGDWARLSLGVHSSLEAVGLTAALSARLAAAGISANIVAGRFHDHFFVPWDRRTDALACMRADAA